MRAPTCRRAPRRSRARCRQPRVDIRRRPGRLRRTGPCALAQDSHAEIVAPVDWGSDACLHRARDPVGRRGQGQGGRLPRGPDGLRGPVSGREQRRPHRHRRGPAAEAPAHPLRHPLRPHHVRDRRRRGGRPTPPAEGDARAHHGRDRREPPEGQRQRAPDHAVSPGAGEGDRALPGEERPGHHEARDRARLRRQGGAHRHPHAGPLRSEDLPREARHRAAREEPHPHEGLQPAAAGRGPHRGGVHGSGAGAGAVHHRHRRVAPSGPAGGQARDARGCAGHAPGPRQGHVSLRHVLEPGGGLRPGLRGHRPQGRGSRHRHREGLRHARGRGPVPHRAARGGGERLGCAARSSAR